MLCTVMGRSDSVGLHKALIAIIAILLVIFALGGFSAEFVLL